MCRFFDFLVSGLWATSIKTFIIGKCVVLSYVSMELEVMVKAVVDLYVQ